MGKVAIVTGGSRGIGEAICVALKDAGFTVAANYAGNAERAKAFTDRTGIATYQWDVSDHEACLAGCAKVAADLGPIDVVVNNAGITRDQLILRMKEEDWDAVIDTNLKGAWNFSKAVLRPMMKNENGGSILNISSVSGVVGMLGQSNYSASKAGMIGLTKSLAKEVASRNITVNALAPGMIETEMTQDMNAEFREKILAAIPLARLGTVQEIADVACFLLSDSAHYITGQVIQADGGLAM